MGFREKFGGFAFGGHTPIEWCHVTDVSVTHIIFVLPHIATHDHNTIAHVASMHAIQNSGHFLVQPWEVAILLKDLYCM